MFVGIPDDDIKGPIFLINFVPFGEAILPKWVATYDINVEVSHKNDWKYNHSNLLFPVKSIRHNVSHLGPYTPHFGVSYHGTMLPSY